jgi:hypothetical protein
LADRLPGGKTGLLAAEQNRRNVEYYLWYRKTNPGIA